MGTQVVYTEQQVIAEIERLELEARNIRRRVEHAVGEADKRVLNRLLADVRSEIQVLRARLG